MTSIAPASALVVATQGLKTASDSFDKAGAKAASDPNAASDPSTAVGLVQSKAAFEANLAVLNAVNQTQRRLLDIKV